MYSYSHIDWNFPKQTTTKLSWKVPEKSNNFYFSHTDLQKTFISTKWLAMMILNNIHF